MQGLFPYLRDLPESAAFLRPERVLALIEGVGVQGESTFEGAEHVDYLVLLKELKLLQKARSLSS
jgi:hypothetical protein